MDTSKTTIGLGIVIVIAVLIGLFFWLKGIVPSQDNIQAGAAEVKTVDKNILSNPSIKKILERQNFGDVPLILSEGDLGKSNPFE